MTVDNTLLPRDGWTGVGGRADDVAHWERRRKEPFRAPELRVTSVTAFIHTRDARVTCLSPGAANGTTSTDSWAGDELFVRNLTVRSPK
ncbi:hypothetical protein GCM10018772_34410 [Streptomyces fumanus]|uniref:Uncharacterized protein n=1 Tax=Streptomyces fumanus TaxID=67302 RepID=A0A919E0M3_9ACTN|nr:hypothetical protein GCM10018772_34410 [Streptomyces fumanus]